MQRSEPLRCDWRILQTVDCSLRGHVHVDLLADAKHKRAWVFESPRYIRNREVGRGGSLLTAVHLHLNHHLEGMILAVDGKQAIDGYGLCAAGRERAAYLLGMKDCFRIRRG